MVLGRLVNEVAGSITGLTLSVSTIILEIIGGSSRCHGVGSVVGGEAGKNARNEASAGV